MRDRHWQKILKALRLASFVFEIQTSWCINVLFTHQVKLKSQLWSETRFPTIIIPLGLRKNQPYVDRQGKEFVDQKWGPVRDFSRFSDLF